VTGKTKLDVGSKLSGHRVEHDRAYTQSKRKEGNPTSSKITQLLVNLAASQAQPARGGPRLNLKLPNGGVGPSQPLLEGTGGPGLRAKKQEFERVP
jgi:hypothetical protein